MCFTYCPLLLNCNFTLEIISLNITETAENRLQVTSFSQISKATERLEGAIWQLPDSSSGPSQGTMGRPRFLSVTQFKWNQRKAGVMGVLLKRKQSLFFFLKLEHWKLAIHILPMQQQLHKMFPFCIKQTRVHKQNFMCRTERKWKRLGLAINFWKFTNMTKKRSEESNYSRSLCRVLCNILKISCRNGKVKHYLWLKWQKHAIIK